MNSPLFSMLITVLSFLPLLSLAGCASEISGGTDIDDRGSDEGAGSGSGDPESSAQTPNHQPISEGAACDMLDHAQSAKAVALQCVVTQRTCPALIRHWTGETCVEYDEGSVRGCVSQLMGAQSCDALANAIQECEVVFFPQTVSPDCT